MKPAVSALKDFLQCKSTPMWLSFATEKDLLELKLAPLNKHIYHVCYTCKVLSPVPTELGQCTSKGEDRILAGAAPTTQEGIICTRSSKMSWKEIDC